MPQIQLAQSFTKIGWDVKRPTYTFEPGHTQPDIEQKSAEMILHCTQPLLQIDQSQCWADMGLMNIFRGNEEFAADARQNALNAIARMVAEGDQMGTIENKGNPISSIAKSDSSLPQHSFQYGNVPGNFSLHYSITPGQLDIQWQPGRTQIDMVSTPSQQNYEMGKIDYYVQQKNQLRIQVVGGKVDTGY